MDLLPAAIVRDHSELRARTEAWRAAGKRVGFAPTMGALHEGHASLVRTAKSECDVVIASIFVNPKQFAPHEDFARYPRDEAGDATQLAAAGCDLIYAPTPDAIYPPGFATSIKVDDVSATLEGQMRPHFFGGVATIVLKLFNQVAPHAAYFGEKDYQQLLVIKRMVKDLDLAIEIIGCATVREADGLAMSSRNAYLSVGERTVAARLNATLREASAHVRAGATIAQVEADAQHALAGAGFTKIDYVAIRDAQTLGAIEKLDRPARILAAAWLGATRLIDNMAV